jgi:hypothetical protein
MDINLCHFPEDPVHAAGILSRILMSFDSMTAQVDTMPQPGIKMMLLDSVSHSEGMLYMPSFLRAC